jgi:hypothetical protein
MGLLKTMNFKIGTNCSRKTGLKFICENTGYELCAGQKKLYEGDDVALVAMAGYETCTFEQAKYYVV